MKLMPSKPADEESAGGLFGFIVSAGLVGALTGLMAASFRMALHAMAEGRTQVLAWAWEDPWVRGIAVIALASAMTSLASALVHKIEPHAEGSGIPRVEAVVAGHIKPGRRRILPVKYVGGLLSIGAGLALGREGPSVQMGGNIAIHVSKLGRRTRYDMRILIAAGAAAGLATAFNAPIAGGVFVLEELVKRFDPRTTLATLTASASGFACSHFFIRGYEFSVPPLPNPSLLEAPSILAVGLVTGVAGVFYNKTILAGLNITQASRMPVEARAAIIGAVVGLVGLFAPNLVGGGDNLTASALAGKETLTALLVILCVRWILGVVSYAALTPGGLFAPTLVMGSGFGLLVGLVGMQIAPAVTAEPAGLAVVGFASFFTATVRAPVTGIVLATEMTGSVTMLSPMLGACAISMLVASLMKSEPIYDALAKRSATAQIANKKIARAEKAAKKN